MSPPSDPRDDRARGEIDVAPAPDDAEDRAAIMARRAMFIATAVAGLHLVSCEGKVVTEPQPCLDMGTTTAGGGGSYPCLSQGGYGGEPQPCLSRPPTGGMGGEPQPCLTSTGGFGGAGGEPQPCLDMGGFGGAGGEPQPCLEMGGFGGAGGTGGGGSPQPCLAPPPPKPSEGAGGSD